MWAIRTAASLAGRIEKFYCRTEMPLKSCKVLPALECSNSQEAGHYGDFETQTHIQTAQMSVDSFFPILSDIGTEFHNLILLFVQINSLVWGLFTMSSSKRREKPQKSNDTDSEEKLRVLCLHGYRQNGNSFKSKIGKNHHKVTQNIRNY